MAKVASAANNATTTNVGFLNFIVRLTFESQFLWGRIQAGVKPAEYIAVSVFRQGKFARRRAGWPNVSHSSRLRFTRTSRHSPELHPGDWCPGINQLQIRVPHLRDSFIVAKVGIRATAGTRFPRAPLKSCKAP